MEDDTVIPDIWMHHMRLGNFDGAWSHSDRVMAERAGRPCWHLPRHFQYVWDGTPLHGKRVLVRCYHGLGDTIQFIRYCRPLQEIASKVIVWAQPPLLRLLATVKGIDQLLPLHDGAPDVEFDVDVEIMELPHVFRSTLATIPSQVPYLHVDAAPIRRRSGQLALGLVWKAGDWDDQRSVPYALLSPLKKITGVEFYILQCNALATGWRGEFGLDADILDLYEYARCISALDLVISIDSMPVHLAGALGVPVWAMLKADADWRWMINREDSPWYPRMRLFRQQHPGDWVPVINKITKELGFL